MLTPENGPSYVGMFERCLVKRGILKGRLGRGGGQNADIDDKGEVGGSLKYDIR